MDKKSAQTRGRTLDHAAWVYDFAEPLLMLGKQTEINGLILRLLEIKPFHRILDVGCGTGILTAVISEKLSPASGGCATGIDAAAKMVEGARKKRETPTCIFEIAAAESLPFNDVSFDSAVSSLFFHHVDLELKEKALAEIFRVLKPGGRLVISDMHTPTTFMGALTSHISRWFFLQPQIGENIRGVLPGLIEKAGFERVNLVSTYFGYISIFSSKKPE